MAPVYGVQLAAKGAERLLEEVDKRWLLGDGTKIWHRPSVLCNTIGGLLLPFAGDVARVGVGAQDALEIVGGHMFSQVVDYAEEALTQPEQPAAQKTNRNTRYQRTPRGKTGQGGTQGVSVKPTLQDGSRYRMT
jgi:hypothetical protein